MTEQERFWRRVTRGAENECWLFEEQRGPRYPQHWVRAEKKYVGAHRVAWTLTHGEIPTEMVVCHRCDNTRCVNPQHLFLGTQRENIQDSRRKGRLNRPKGSEHGFAKLDEATVVAIRKRYAEGGVSQSALARRYGIAPSVMNRLIHRKIWRHV